VDPQLVAKYAIESLAKAVVLAHNHPSGNLTPSSQDLDITKRIRAGLDLFNITLLDHIILTSDHYTSLGDEGLL
jgi:DNA repair protein RadC